ANLADGLSHSLAALGDRIAGSPVDPGFPDMRIRPVPDTLGQIPWDPTTAWCIAHVDAADPQSAIAPRSVLDRAVEGFHAIGLTPFCAAEFEFYLLRRDEARLTRYTNQLAMVYTVGERSDPMGLVRDMVRTGRQAGLEANAVHHECGRGQFEINLKYSE